MNAQVIFLPPYAITYQEAQRNQELQDQINSRRAQIRNWALDKSSYEVAQVWIANRKRMISQIYLVRS